MTVPTDPVKGNQILEVLFRVIGPYAPPEAIVAYWKAINQRWVRNLDGISDKSMLLLVSTSARGSSPPRLPRRRSPTSRG